MTGGEDNPDGVVPSSSSTSKRSLRKRNPIIYNDTKAKKSRTSKADSPQSNERASDDVDDIKEDTSLDMLVSENPIVASTRTQKIQNSADVKNGVNVDTTQTNGDRSDIIDCDHHKRTKKSESNSQSDNDTLPLDMNTDAVGQKDMSMDDVLVVEELDRPSFLDESSVSKGGGDVYDDIYLSSDEDIAEQNNDEVSLVVMKRPPLVPSYGDPTTAVECIDLLDSDEEFPVCLGPATETESVAADEKDGYVKEYIENEGLGLIHSGADDGLVLFHLADVLIDGQKYAQTRDTRKHLPIGTHVKFYSKTFESPDFKVLCEEMVMVQAVVVWTSASRPEHVRRIVDDADAAFWQRLDEFRKTFLLYIKGEVLLGLALARVKGTVKGYYNSEFGLIEVRDATDERVNVVFHVDEVRIFKKPVADWNLGPIYKVLPVGINVTVDAHPVRADWRCRVRPIVYQAACVLAGSWPTTPHPTLIPGGRGTYAPIFEPPVVPSTWYYMELVKETELHRKADKFRELLERLPKGTDDFMFNNVRFVQGRDDIEEWRGQFVANYRRRPEYSGQKRAFSQKRITHRFKMPLIKKFKTKQEMDDSSVAGCVSSSIRSSLNDLSSFCSNNSHFSGSRSSSAMSMRLGSEAGLAKQRTWYDQNAFSFGGLRLKQEVKSESGIKTEV